jgi:hypothetical protein
LESDDGFIKIWRVDPESLAVQSFGTAVYPVRSTVDAGWEVRVDEYLLTQLSDLRRSRLKNETGGILVGTYDMERRIIYIGDIIPSPKDSREYPTAYIRGISGVREQLDEYSRILGGTFTYIGEWHSHPDRADTNRSPDDEILFDWLHGHMTKHGLPALMGIVGDTNITFYVKQ